MVIYFINVKLKYETKNNALNNRKW